MRKIRIKEGQTNEKMWGKKKNKDMNPGLKGWIFVQFSWLKWTHTEEGWGQFHQPNEVALKYTGLQSQTQKTELRPTSKPGVSNTRPARRVCVARTHLKNWLNCKFLFNLAWIESFLRYLWPVEHFFLECGPLINFEFETPVLSCTVYAMHQ